MLHKECDVFKCVAMLLALVLVVFAPYVALAEEEDLYSVNVSDCIYDGGEQMQETFEIESVPLTSLSFSKTSVTVIQGKTYQTSLVKAPSNASSTITYISSNTAVAKVDANGKITAVKPGEATITAKSSDGVKATCTVTVKLPVVNASARPNGLGKIKVSWSKAANASGYYVYRSTSKTGVFKRVATVKSNSMRYFSDSGLAKGKVYYYKVKPYYSSNSRCNGGYSAIISAKATVKAPTMNSTVNTTSASTIKVTWSKVLDADGYYVYRKRTSSSLWTRIATVKGAGALTYTDKKASGIDYYAVAAYNNVSVGCVSPL